MRLGIHACVLGNALLRLLVVIVPLVILVGSGNPILNDVVNSTYSLHRESPSVVLTRENLDDPANPYYGMYKEWDYWILEHQIAKDDYDGYAGEDWHERICLVGELDEEGWLIPQLESVHIREGAISEGFRSEYDGLLQPDVWAQGEMDPGMYSDYLHATWKIEAMYYPEIPAFLAENPPHMVMLVEDDRYVTRGIVGSGSHKELIPGANWTTIAKHPDGVPDWCLYDRTGQLLGVTEEPWYALFGVSLGTIMETAHTQGCETTFLANVGMGYIGYNDELTGKLKLLYNYDGTELTPDLEQHRRDEHRYLPIPAEKLIYYYEVQQCSKTR